MLNMSKHDIRFRVILPVAGPKLFSASFSAPRVVDTATNLSFVTGQTDL